ncbi:unnamed protein product [Rotaria socialis]|uniref:acylglycerol lipase n=1 Tax=Rotaria socialis TaxID=392032 RepID=A0A819AG09_9BILA|nr:unnamed protein product [Rotaria socialis]
MISLTLSCIHGVPFQLQNAFKFTAYQAGLTKHLLLTDNNGVPASFSYTEKGSRNREKPSIVFVHGLSSNKETWIPIVKNIPSDYHCITVDLPGHGETVGFNEDRYSIDTFVEKLKLFFDLMDLTEPLCIIGASMGGAIVCMFAIKYPEYVSMICLLAPIANEASETDLIRQLRNGEYNALLPETPGELRQMINTLTVRTPKLPKPFLNGFLHLRLRLLDEHKKILTSLIGYDYSHIEQHYQQLRQLNRPALILWGRQDKVYAASGAEFFCNLLPNTECIIFDECGHFMAIDKPEETARSILAFFDSYANYQLLATELVGERATQVTLNRLKSLKNFKMLTLTVYLTSQAKQTTLNNVNQFFVILNMVYINEVICYDSDLPETVISENQEWVNAYY